MSTFECFCLGEQMVVMTNFKTIFCYILMFNRVKGRVFYGPITTIQDIAGKIYFLLFKVPQNTP